MKRTIALLASLLCAPVAWTAEVAEPAFLRESVPEDAMAYVRIPNLWGFLSAPKGSMLNAALSDEQHVEQVNALRESLRKNLLQQIEEFAGPAATLLLHHLRSPVEAVALLEKNSPLPIPNVVVTARIGIDSMEAMSTLLERMAATTEGMQVFRGLSPEGSAILGLQEQFPLFLHFDLESQTLSLMGGATANEQVHAETRALLAEKRQHPMQSLEANVDSSRQGLFVWVNMQRVLSTYGNAMPPEQKQQLDQWGLSDMRALALGWGVSNDRGRLKLVLDAPRGGYRNVLPPIENDLTLTAAGTPKLAAILSIPALATLRGVEKIMTAEGGPKATKEYQAAKQQAADKLGVSVEEILQAFGNEMVVLMDEAGESVALRIGDKSKLDNVVTRLVEKFQLPRTKHELDGKTFHHIKISDLGGLAASMAKVDADAPSAFLVELLSRYSSHVYWVEDDGYLVFASVPQILIDRMQSTNRVSVKQWLTEQQKQDVGASLASLSMTMPDTPRRLYYVYLQTLEFLADFAKLDLNLFTLPTARQLELPATGRYGMQIDLAESLIGLELSFENNPLEFLLASNHAVNFAILGVLAGIAIPAYEDYTVRAEVAEGLQLAIPVQRAIEAAFATSYAPPADRSAAGLSPDPGDDSGVHVDGVDVDNGVILITFGNEAADKIYGQALTLTPYETPDLEIVWRCGSAPTPEGLATLGTAAGQGVVYRPPTVAAKFLPKQCRE